MSENGLKSGELMNIEQTHRMQSDFDSLAQALPGDGIIEVWFARDLQEPLGYAHRENFMTAIQRVIESCETTGYKSEHHFRGVTKMVALGSGAERRVEDFMLTHKRVTKHRLTRWYQLVTFSHASVPPP
jgi:DNA-damage-inducible protein D